MVDSRNILSMARIVALYIVLAPGLAWAVCAGDCDGRAGVSIDELVMGVSIALDEAPIDSCPNLDTNGDLAVTVDEVVLALRDALTNCETVLPFASIQQVFSQSCALSSCHSALARSGDLVLIDEELSWDNLVLRPSYHPEAKDAGAEFRVVPGDLDASYLVRKLRGMGPGDTMPVVGHLNEETIHMIEDWIERGAPTTEDECTPPVDAGGGSHRGTDSANCDGQTPPPVGNFEWAPQEPLPAPEPGKGIQFYTPPRDIEPGDEWETCFAFRVDTSQLDTTFLKRQEYRMHDGSHHLLLYNYFGQNADDFTFGEYWDCFAGNCIDREDCPADSGTFQIPIGGTQVAGTSYVVEYPDGVGIPILGVQPVIIANLHYQNPFLPEQPIYGESWINLEVYEEGEFKVILDGIFAINAGDLIVEPYETKTISRLWTPRGLLTPQTDVAIFQLFGHFHKRGIEFTIHFVDEDGSETQIYRTTEWDNAPVTDYPPPYLHVGKDQKLRWSCTHQNGRQGDPLFPPKRCHEGCDACGWRDETRTCVFTRDRSNRVYEEGDPMPLAFGALADDDMCNMFGYFIQQKDLPKIGLQ